MRKLRNALVYSADTDGCTASPEKRQFRRRRSTLTGLLSADPDFATSWPVQIDNISLAGMRLLGTVPPLSEKDLLLKLDAGSDPIECVLVTQDEHGLRVAVDIQRLDIENLITRHDVFASMVLETIASSK